MIREAADGIYTFEIVLPNNPLKWLNCYVIKGGKGRRNLLIDSGFHKQECLDSLLLGMKELELKPEETDVFFTHCHSDHTGNGYELSQLGCRIFMGEIDYRQALCAEFRAVLYELFVRAHIRYEVFIVNGSKLYFFDNIIWSLAA